MKQAIIPSLALSLTFAAASAFGQDCQWTDTFTSAIPAASHNVTSAGASPCVAWRVTYDAKQMTALSLQLEGAGWNALGTGPGAFVAISGSAIVQGSNPMVDPDNATVATIGTVYYPFVRLNMTLFTKGAAAAVATARVYGYGGTSAAISGGTPIPPPPPPPPSILQSVHVTGAPLPAFTLPNSAPWTTLGASTQPMRWELRLHDFGTDLPTSFLVNLGPVVLKRGFSANQVQASLASSPNPGDTIYNNGPIVGGCCNIMTDILVRVQRDVVNSRYTLEICLTTGGGCLTGTATITAFELNPSWVGWTLGLNGGGDIAFLRWFSSVVPLGTLIPNAGVTGDLGDWEFEGDLTDSAHANDFSGGTVAYSATPTYVPACNAGTQQTFRVGYPGTLDGSGSYPLDGGSTLTHVWTQLSGPSLSWTNQNTVAPGITPSAFGTYVFQLAVTDSSSNTVSCTVKDGAVATDGNDILITGIPAVDTLLGPMVRLGANPWPWYDNRHRTAADLENAAMDSYFPAWWNTPAPGTITVSTGSAAVVGVGTTFTTTFCQGPGSPSVPKTGSYGYSMIAIWHPLGPGTGRVMQNVTSCADDAHLTLGDPYNDDGRTLPGSGLTYAADDTYAGRWGWSQVPSPANYYDNVAGFYSLYYRSGIDDYLTAARKLADRFWENPPIDQGVHPVDFGYTGRSVSAMGLVLRALDGRPEMWAAPAGAPAGGLHTIWDDYLYYLNTYDPSRGIWDIREEGYHLAFISYCAMFDTDATYRSTCQTALSNSFAAVWTPNRSLVDGGWPQLTSTYSTIISDFLDSWHTPSTVTATHGSATVTGAGTNWQAGDFPAGTRIWFTNANWRPVDNSGGDPIDYFVSSVDSPTQLTLAIPYQGTTSGSHGWEVGNYNYNGWNIQPYGEGILSGAFDLVAKALATVDPTTAALAQSYNVSAANWVMNYGYWPLTKGLYYVVGGIDCQPPISDLNTLCTSGMTNDQSRTLSAEVFRGVGAAYAFGHSGALKTFGDTLYNAMWAKPTTCPVGSTLCVPDGFYINPMDDGQYMINTPPYGSLGAATPWKWFGQFFGFPIPGAWPGYRLQ